MDHGICFARRAGRIAGLAAAVAFSLFLAACGSSGEGSGGSAATAEPSGSVTASPAQTSSPQADLVWPTAYQDRRLLGRSAVDGPAKKRAGWTARLSSQTRAWAILDADGRVITGDSSRVTAFDPTSGDRVWSTKLGAAVRGHALARADGSVVVSAGKRVVCLSRDGSEVWSYTTPSEADSPAAGADGTLYVGSLGGTLVALSPDGEELWQHEADAAIHSPSVADDGTLYCGGAPLLLHALAADGTPLWTLAPRGRLKDYKGVYPWVNCLQSPSIADDGTLYAGSQVTPALWVDGHEVKDYDFPKVGSLFAVSPSGKKLWEYDHGTCATLTPTIGTDGTLYAGTSAWRVVALTPAGNAKWQFVTGHGSCPFVYSPPIGADGMLYAGTSNGELYCITPEGKERWRYAADHHQLPDLSSNNLTPPALAADGALYTTLYEGRVLQFE